MKTTQSRGSLQIHVEEGNMSVIDGKAHHNDWDTECISGSC